MVSFAKPDRNRAGWHIIAAALATAIAATGLYAAIVWMHPTPSAKVGQSAAPSPALTSLALPIRAAFYYPWFPEAWRQQGMDPFTHYSPTLGYYGTTLSTARQQIRAMQYAGIRAGIASWWGQNSATDGRVAMLLTLAAATGFKWALYYEPEGQGDPSVSSIASDLAYISGRYATQPGYLRVLGRPVLFVYADGNDGCGMAQRWKQANTLGFFMVLKVFAGYRTCAGQPDGWHQYAPAAAEDSQAGFSFAISPGFWKANENTPRLERDSSRWATSIQDMVASHAPWQLITTFNEWGEGTAVEDATQWQSATGFGLYLDALHGSA